MAKVEKKKIINNSFWLVGQKFITLALSMITTGYVARYLGTSGYGIFNYAFAFVGLFTAFSEVGLRNIMIRDLAQEKHSAGTILGTAFVIRLIAALTTIALIVLLSFIIMDDTTTIHLTLIFSLMSLFQVSNIFQIYNQSKLLSKYSVIGGTIAFVISSLLKIYFVYIEASILAIGAMNCLEIILTGMITYIIFYKKTKPKPIFDFNKNLAFSFLKESWPLVLSGIAITVYMKIDQVMLGKMLGEDAVGIYSAAVKISSIVMFFPNALSSSLVPAISKAKLHDQAKYHFILIKSLSALTIISITMAIATNFSSFYIINFIFGAEFVEASIILNVHIWSSIFVFLGVGSSPWFVNENLNIYALIKTVIGAFANVLLNFILIPIYGGLGAAYATLFSQFISAFLLNIIFAKTRPIFWMQLKGLTLIPLLKKH